MRQIYVRSAVAESKLQDFHSRYIELLAKVVDFTRDVAEVFSDERQLAQGRTQGIEQLRVRPFDPVTIDGRRLVGRYLPTRLEAAEVIEPQDVAGFDPP